MSLESPLIKGEKADVDLHVLAHIVPFRAGYYQKRLAGSNVFTLFDFDLS
jgi:hypothetical protein